MPPDLHEKTWLRGLSYAMPHSFKGAVQLAESYLGQNPHFVFISSGRSGSGFIANLLTRSDIPCAHEGFFQPTGYSKRFWYKGDSSWLAVPFLEQGIGGEIQYIIHHTRHPLDVLSSYEGIRFFYPDSQQNEFRKFLAKYFNVTGNSLVDAMRFWIEWNLRCEKLANATFRLEDKEKELPKIARMIGGSWSETRLQTELSQFSDVKVNARVRREVRFDDLPNVKEKAQLAQLAQKYGYDLND